jgi:hypothetical protein
LAQLLLLLLAEHDSLVQQQLHPLLSQPQHWQQHCRLQLLRQEVQLLQEQ